MSIAPHPHYHASSDQPSPVITPPAIPLWAVSRHALPVLARLDLPGRTRPCCATPTADLPRLACYAQPVLSAPGPTHAPFSPVLASPASSCRSKPFPFLANTYHACHAFQASPTPYQGPAEPWQVLPGLALSSRTSPRLPCLKLQLLLRIGYAASEIPERPPTVPLDARTSFQMSLIHPKRLRAFVHASIY